MNMNSLIKSKNLIMVALFILLSTSECTKTKYVRVERKVETSEQQYIILATLDQLSNEQKSSIHIAAYLDICDKEVLRLFSNPDYQITFGPETEVWLSENNLSIQPAVLSDLAGKSDFNYGQRIVQLSCLALEIQEQTVTVELKLQMFDIPTREMVFEQTESRIGHDSDLDQAILSAVNETIRMLGASLQSRLNLKLNFSSKFTDPRPEIYRKPVSTEAEPEVELLEIQEDNVADSLTVFETFFVEYYPRAPKMDRSCRGNLEIRSSEINFKGKCGEFYADPQKMVTNDYGQSSVNMAKGEKTIFVKSENKLFYILAIDDSGIPTSSTKLLRTLENVIEK